MINVQLESKHDVGMRSMECKVITIACSVGIQKFKV